MDFPTAWEIARATPVAEHDPRCSYAQHNGGFLCDCHVLTGHPQYIADCGEPAFRTCYECGHVYPTSADLLAEHAALVATINAETSPDNPPMVAQTDPGQVYACPACAHDF